MVVAAFVVSVAAALAAAVSVWFARQSAKAAIRSADVAEIVEKGRHHGWRIEARTNAPVRNYTLRNVGTVNARNVSLSGDYMGIEFRGSGGEPIDIAAGQARLFRVMQALGDRGGEIHITWTPDLPNAGPLTWTESPPMARFWPPFNDADWRNLRTALENLADRR